MQTKLLEKSKCFLMYVTRILNINLDLIQVMGAVTGEEKGTEPMLVMELMDHGCEF